MASIVDPDPDGKTGAEDCPVCGRTNVPVSDTGNFAHHLIPGTLEQRNGGLSCSESGDASPSALRRCRRCRMDFPDHIPGDADCRLHSLGIDRLESAARIDELRGWVRTLRIAADSPGFRRASRKAYAQVADMLENAANLRESGDA